MTTQLLLQEVSRLAASLPSDQPVCVVNLLRFRAAAQYATQVKDVGASGQEAYMGGYLPAFDAVTKGLGVQGPRVLWAGAVLASLSGPAEADWHAAAVIEYANFGVFVRIVESDLYRELAEPYRLAALDDWRLLASKQMDLPG